MNFDLTEEQLMLQDTVKQFLENECPVTRLREIFDGDTGHDPVLWQGMAEMGLAGLHVPEQYGGAGLEILDLAIAGENMGYSAAPVPFLGHSLAALAITLGGSQAQKEKWLPGLASGERIGTVAFCEEEAAWQPDQWRLSPGATLNGHKEYVTFANFADLFVVGLAGGELAVVEKDASGIELEDLEGADRTRRFSRLSFAKTPCELLEKGADVSGHVRDVALTLLAADAFGGAERCLDMCVEYSKTREQFGVKIGNFQALKHQLASMALDVEPMRGLYWFTAYAMDHESEQKERMASVAKAHITDRFMQVGRDSVEVHGGIGFTWECDVQIWFKRAMFDRAYLGTPAFHRERSVQLADW